MNAATLYQLFGTSFSPDQQARKAAERQLKEIDDAPEFIPQVLHILGAGESELPVKQAAAIYLKNKIRTSWDPSPHSPVQVISDAVKATVRDNLLALMAHTQPAVRTQLVDCLRPMLAADFPEKWPTYLPQTREFLQSKDTPVVHTGLLTLFIVIRFYQYKSGPSERAHLEEIISVCFPLLLAIGDTLLGMPGDEPAQMLKLVFRCYYTAIQTELSPALQEQPVLMAWGTLLLKALKRPFAANAGASTEDVARDEDWKARKWAMRCLNRLFSGYGNPALLPSSQRHYLPFANQFIEHFAPEIVQTYFELVERYVAHQVVFSPKCLCLLATFLSDAIKHKATWKLVKPHTENLVQHFIFPQLMYTTEDEELWEDNPTDYVHKRMDPLDDFDSPVVAATNLLLDLATDRRKHCFQIILNFINSVAVAYAQQEDPAARDPHQKDGALNMLGALAQIVLHKKSPVRNNMEEFMAVHVFPEFTSANPFLRLRALAFYCQYCDLELSNTQHLQFVYGHTLHMLQDSQIPIRVQAALTLQPLIQHEQVRNAIVPNLPQIMQQFLDLTNELDIDTLSTVMEEFVETFSDHMAPIATQLCSQLSNTYLRIMREAVGTEADPQADIDYGSLADKTFAAMGVLRTITTLIMNLENSPETVAQLETHLVPLVGFTLQQELVDLYDDVFEIIDGCTFTLKHISPAMWTLLPLIHKTFDGEGFDYFDVMLPTLDNYVSYGAEQVASNTEILQLLMHFYQRIMQSDRSNEQERICGCKLVEALMLNCRDRIDGLIPDIIQHAMHYIAMPDGIKSRGFLVYALEVVLNALYYNPQLTLGVLEGHGWTQGYFGRLTQSVNKFKRVHDKKLLIAALCAVIAVPSPQLPVSIQGGLAELFGTLLRSFETLPRAFDKRAHQEGKFSLDDLSGSEDEIDGDLDDLDDFVDEEVDEDDDVPDADREYLDFLTRKGANLREDGTVAIDGSDGENNDEETESEHGSNEDGDDLDEEILFESPLDKVDVYHEFKTIFNQLQASQTPVFQALTQNLTPDQQEFIVSVLNTNETLLK